MKALTSTLIAAFLATGTLSAHVAAAESQGLEKCRAEVTNYYGVEDFKYVGQRRARDGIQMKFAIASHDASTGNTSTRMATCLLQPQNMQASIVENNGAMMADIHKSLAASMTASVAVPAGR